MIKFLLDNGLIKKTKSGILYDISFKFNSQTDAKEYGKKFTPSIKLSDFIDLKTGELKTKKAGVVKLLLISHENSCNIC